jgi:hypothetical protein
MNLKAILVFLLFGFITTTLFSKDYSGRYSQLEPKYSITDSDSVRCDSLFTDKYLTKNCDDYWGCLRTYISYESKQYIETGEICHLYRLFALNSGDETASFIYGPILDSYEKKYRKKEYRVRLYFVSLVASTTYGWELFRRERIIDKIGLEYISTYANKYQIMNDLFLIEQNYISSPYEEKYLKRASLYKRFISTYKVLIN